jgi:cytochrome P450 / NADPH-cytochrome P450 reductase
MGDELLPIPEPPALPIIGHVTYIDRENPRLTFIQLADKYGEIYRVRFGSRATIIVNSHALVDELCDEKRFIKIPDGGLAEIRNGVNDGLFTAMPDEPAWGVAHRVLMPAFGPIGIKGMFEEMHDVASQMCLKFARYGPQANIHVSDDFTRLALDTLALCTMGYRFNSFYAVELHPFIQAMGDFLTESGSRSQRIGLPSFYYRKADQKYWADIDVLRKTANEVLQERKKEPLDAPDARKDLLSAMLVGKDPKTGQKMTDSSIIDNLVTFLIAGHETTGATLSFAFYMLLKHPEVYRKAQGEVDQVIGKGPIKVEHMNRLPYLEAILRETLRLNSPIIFFGVKSADDTVIGGKYMVKKGDSMLLHLTKSHRDPEVWGPDAEDFNPERMTTENFNKLPRNAWKPFGKALSRLV